MAQAVRINELILYTYKVKEYSVYIYMYLQLKNIMKVQ